MKAIEILRDIMQDADIAEYGDLIILSADNGIKSWFGESAKLTKGNIEIDNGESHYLALWDSLDETYGYIEKKIADAVISTEDDTIYLYKIED